MVVIKGIVNKEYGRENYTLEEALELFNIHPCKSIEEVVKELNVDYGTDKFEIGYIVR